MVAHLHRRPAGGGYPRGEDTRKRIIEAAMEMFGRNGYHRTSTREIAVRAQVNPPALQYYFNGKFGLYFACVDQVTRAIAGRMQPVLQHAEETLLADTTADELIEEICRIMDVLVDAFYEKSEGPNVRLLMKDGDDYGDIEGVRYLMRDRVDLPNFRIISMLIGKIVQLPPEDIKTGLHAFAVFGIPMAFFLDEARIFEATGWRDPNPQDIELLKSIIRTQTTILLRGLAATPTLKAG